MRWFHFSPPAVAMSGLQTARANIFNTVSPLMFQLWLSSRPSLLGLCSALCAFPAARSRVMTNHEAFPKSEKSSQEIICCKSCLTKPCQSFGDFLFLIGCIFPWQFPLLAPASPLIWQILEGKQRSCRDAKSCCSHLSWEDCWIKGTDRASLLLERRAPFFSLFLPCNQRLQFSPFLSWPCSITSWLGI